MKELDELKNIWQKQPAPDHVTLDNKYQDSIIHRLEAQRKKIFRGNVFATTAMLITISFLSWMLFYYDDEQPLFYVSITAVIIVVIGVLFILWSRNLKGVSQLSLDSKSYVNFQIKKLVFNKKLIQYSPLYGFVLGLLINGYAYSLISEATGEFVFWMTNINWIYIFLVSYISYTVKMRKYEKNIEPIVKELQTLSIALDESND